MKAVILVGGEGTRLRPLTYDLPKPMVPIVNKPFMEHLVDYLVRYGFDEIIFAQGYKSEAFQRYFANGARWGARFHHVVEDFPLDTAGPVKNVERLLGSEPFLVLNGDILADLDLGALLDLHRRLGAAATLALTPVDDPSAYGVVVTDAEHRVQAFIEKPPRDQAPSNAINAGVYVLDPAVLRYMPAGERHSFERQFFPTLVREGEKLCAATLPGYWLDIGSPERYLRANRDVLTGAVRVELPPSPDGDRQWIGAGSRVDPGALLEGALWIGEGCVVERGARLEGPLVLGARCHVGADARVRGSVVWDDSRLGAAASLDAALVGRGCTLGAGAALEPHAVLGSGQALEARAALATGERLPV